MSGLVDRSELTNIHFLTVSMFVYVRKLYSQQLLYLVSILNDRCFDQSYFVVLFEQQIQLIPKLIGQPPGSLEKVTP